MTLAVGSATGSRAWLDTGLRPARPFDASRFVLLGHLRAHGDDGGSCGWLEIIYAFATGARFATWGPLLRAGIVFPAGPRVLEDRACVGLRTFFFCP